MAFWKRVGPIDLAISYHTSANLIIHPKYPPKDQRKRYADICAIYESMVYPHSLAFEMSGPSRRGLTMDWFGRVRGAVALSVEMNPLPGVERERAMEDVHPAGGYKLRRANRLLCSLRHYGEVHAEFLLALIRLLREDPSQG
jgi:hypothetical protein